MEFTGVVFVSAMLFVLVFSGFVKLFGVNGSDVQRMMMGDYYEYLKTVGAQDSEESRQLFEENYRK